MSQTPGVAFDDAEPTIGLDSNQIPVAPANVGDPPDPTSGRTGAVERSSLTGPWWATALRWIGVLALVLSTLLVYTNRTILDSDGFADRTVAALQNDAVANEIAQQVTDEIILPQRPDLIGVRPLIVSTVESILQSDAGQSVVRLAAEKAHDVAFTEGGNQLLLNLQDLRVLVEGALAVLGTAAGTADPSGAEIAPEEAATAEAEDAPEDSADGSVEIPVTGEASDQTVNLWQTAERFQAITLVMLLLGVGFLLAGILTARSRRRAMLAAGLGLATGAVILAVVVLVGKLAVTWATDNPAFVGGIYDAFLVPLILWCGVLALIGVVLAAAAAALLDRVDVDEWLRSVAGVVTRTPRRGVWRVVHGLALIAAGTLVALHPVTALGVAAVGAGVLLAFLGLREVLDLVVGPAPAPRGATAATASVGGTAGGPEPTGGKAVPWRIALASVIAVAIAGTSIAWLSTRTESVSAAGVEGCNGSEELCDKRFDEVTLAGTHNAMAAADVPGWLFPNQQKNIPSQLDDGVRAFMLDTHVGIPTESGTILTDLEAEPTAIEDYAEFVGQEGVDAALRIRDRVASEPQGESAIYLCHGFCELGAQKLEPVLESIRAWMIANPGAVITLLIQDDGGTPEQVAQVFADSGLIDLVWTGAVPTKDGSGEFPTLREMVETNERVLVFHEKQEGEPSPDWYHQMYDTFMETPYKFEGPDAMGCEPNRGGTEGSLFLVNNWIETAPAPRPSNAEIVNSYDTLLARVERCETERAAVANVVAVDFYLSGDVVGVADTLNGPAPQ